MKMIRWDPFRELETISNRLNQVFNQPLLRTPDEEGLFADWAPAMDVEETDTEYVVKTDLPDVKKEDVKIAIDKGVLSVEGERRQQKEQKTKKFHRLEREYGKFVRRLAIPADVEDAKAQAEVKDGVLVVRLPKSAATKAKQIDVKIA